MSHLTDIDAAVRMTTRKDGEDQGTGLGLATRTRTRTKKPSPYKVLMLNDDYTPMEFVVLCLQRFFRMNIEDATRVMLHVHQKGVGVCGVFSYEVAETKVSQVVDFARQNQHPLQCTDRGSCPRESIALPLITSQPQTSHRPGECDWPRSIASTARSTTERDPLWDPRRSPAHW